MRVEKPVSKGNVDLLRSILGLAIPIMLGAGVQTSYHLINIYWVGRLGTDAIAIVSICFPLNLLMISIGSGLALAISILVSQEFGAKAIDRVNHTVSQSLVAMTGIALLLALIGYVSSPWVLHAMGVPGHIEDAAVVYARISFVSIVFMFLSSFYQSVLRGVGAAKAPLPLIAASVVLNAVLDPLLIFGVGSWPGLGVNGAAWATLITQMLTALLGLRLMLGPRFGLALQRPRLRQDWSIVQRMLKLGLPASVEQSMQSLYVSVMTILVAKFGAVALAAYGFVFRILTFTVIPAFSVSIAISILVGQYIGAGDRHQLNRIGRVSALFGFACMSVVGAAFFVWAEPVAAFFMPNDEALLPHATLALRIFAISFPLSAAQLALTGLFRGAGDTFNTMLLTLIGTWVIQLPLALVLPATSLGVSGLWWSGTLAAVITLCITWIYFSSARWSRKIVVEPATAKLDATPDTELAGQ